MRTQTHKYKLTSRGAQKFPVRKAGHRNSGNNWVSERSSDPSQSRFPALCHCLCYVCCFTIHRNNSPSGSSSSFVVKDVSWHHSVPGWRCCWYTQREMSLIYSDTLSVSLRPWAPWGLFCVACFCYSKKQLVPHDCGVEFLLTHKTQWQLLFDLVAVCSDFKCVCQPVLNSALP